MKSQTRFFSGLLAYTLLAVIFYIVANALLDDPVGAALSVQFALLVALIINTVRYLYGTR